MKSRLLLLLALLSFGFSNAQIVNIPNASFKAFLVAASPSTMTASTQNPNSINGGVTNYHTIDTNGDGEIQVSEAILIKYLNLSLVGNIPNIDGINSFTNVRYLNCDSHPITSLNIDSLTNLQFLNCASTQLTSLNVTNSTNLKILTCSHSLLTNINVSGLTNLTTLYCEYNSLTSLNLNGLTSLQELTCWNNQLSSLNLSNLPNLTSVICTANQLTSLIVSNLPSLIGLSCASNLLTNLDISTLSSIQNLTCSYNHLTTLNFSSSSLKNLDCGHNQLTNLNIIGCPNLEKLDCEQNNLTTLDASNLIHLIDLDCHNNQLNVLFVKRNSGVWYTDFFDILFNPNLIYICASNADIAFVQSKINQYGYTNTCTVNSYCSFTYGGTSYIIQGENKFDDDNNGCDVADSVYPNLKFTITNSTLFSNIISNASGAYSMPVQSGSHTITPQFENPTYFTASPTNAVVSFPTTVSPATRNFCIIPNGIHHDLEVVIIPLLGARPGVDATYKIKYKNKGVVSETATINFSYDDTILDFISSTLAPTSQSTGLRSWNIGVITPFQTGEFIVTINVNSQTETPPVNAGNILHYTAVINGLNTDETPVDNTFSLHQLVVNSLDPNDKTCLEGTTITPSMVGQYVHYKIRFENTGTANAQNIVVKDLIDTAKFDLTSLQITDSSHSCVTRITNPNVVEFIFQNINLPFAVGSNTGYVTFKIKTISTLVVGNTFSNLVNIYFDYNFPIVTNNYTTTVQALGVNQNLTNGKISVYPNPVKDFIHFDTQENVIKVEVYDIAGRILSSNSINENKLNLNGLQTGNYILKVYTESGISNTKIIKE